VLGGYTTFSSFSLEAARMIQSKAWLGALGYSLISVVVCVSMVFLGMFLMRKLLA